MAYQSIWYANFLYVYEKLLELKMKYWNLVKRGLVWSTVFSLGFLLYEFFILKNSFHLIGTLVWCIAVFLGVGPLFALATDTWSKKSKGK